MNAAERRALRNVLVERGFTRDVEARDDSEGHAELWNHEDGAHDHARVG